MSESVLFRLRRAETQAIAEAVETWQTEHATAMLARDVEEAVHECLKFPKHLRQTYESVFERAVAGHIEDFQETGGQLRALFDSALQVVDLVGKQVRELEHAGYRIGSASQLPLAALNLEGLKNDIFEHWPLLLSEAELTEVRLGIARGESLELDEAFAQIAGVDVETWKKRVEEYKRGRSA